MVCGGGVDKRRGNGEAKRAKLLSDWAQSKFGMTASVHPDATNDASSKTHATTIRFMDVCSDPDTTFNDGQNLLNEVEMHECSKFCMREINKEQ